MYIISLYFLFNNISGTFKNEKCCKNGQIKNNWLNFLLKNKEKILKNFRYQRHFIVCYVYWKLMWLRMIKREQLQTYCHIVGECSHNCMLCTSLFNNCLKIIKNLLIKIHSHRFKNTIKPKTRTLSSPNCTVKRPKTSWTSGHLWAWPDLFLYTWWTNTTEGRREREWAGEEEVSFPVWAAPTTCWGRSGWPEGRERKRGTSGFESNASIVSTEVQKSGKSNLKND